MSISEELLEAMPGKLKDFFIKIAPKGVFDISFEPLYFETNAQGQTEWEFQCRLTLRDFFADLGFSAEHCKGVLTGHGAIDQEGRMSFDAATEIEEAVLAGWHLRHLAARLILDPQVHTLRIIDGATSLYGGDGTGFAVVDFKEHHCEYRASFTIRGVQWKDYVQVHGAPEARKPEGSEDQAVRGSISGRFVMRGATGSRSHREGAGELRIREANVWKLPIFLAIFQVLNLTPDPNVFHDGRLEFFLSQDKLTLHKIDLQGSAMSFIGGGTMDLTSDQMDVTVLAGSPVRIRVPLLTEILEGASREIMELHVTGTVGKPVIKPQPLRSLTAVLETLFPEAPHSIQERPISPPMP